jgi:hypothetical protein
VLRYKFDNGLVGFAFLRLRFNPDQVTFVRFHDLFSGRSRDHFNTYFQIDSSPQRLPCLRLFDLPINGGPESPMRPISRVFDIVLVISLLLLV